MDPLVYRSGEVPLMKGTLSPATSEVEIVFAHVHNTTAPAHDIYKYAATFASTSIYTSSTQAVCLSPAACNCATAAVMTFQIHAQSYPACSLKASLAALQLLQQPCQSVFCSWHVLTKQDGLSAQRLRACSSSCHLAYRPLWHGFPLSIGIPAFAR